MNPFRIRLLLFVVSLFYAFPGNAQTVWQVGPTKTYKTPGSIANLVKAGDIVEIDASVYENDFVTWSKDNLTIKGVNGKPHLRATTSPSNGKGIWVIAGNKIRVENIEFSGCRVPDRNGAGIRVEGAGAIIDNCYFHDNEMGILQGIVKKYNLTIQYSEFYKNGINGSGQNHNVYIGNIDTLYFRFNYSHDSYIGHELKSRAANNWIEYNVISNETTGDSRTIDLPNGGYSVIIGNVITQSPQSENYHILGYGLEGLDASYSNNLYVVNNTFVNFKGTGTFIQTRSGTSKAYVFNNIFAGKYSEGMIVTYNGITTPLDSIGNMYFPDISSAGFINAANLELNLQGQSPAINKARVPALTTTGYPLIPQYEFYKSFGVKKLNLTGKNRYDAGAYQTGKDNMSRISDLSGTSGISVMVTGNLLHVSDLSGELISTIQISDLSGRLIHQQSAIGSSVYDYALPDQHSVYIVKISTGKSTKTCKIFANK